jgi:hypothetical protein
MKNIKRKDKRVPLFGLLYYFPFFFFLVPTRCRKKGGGGSMTHIRQRKTLTNGISGPLSICLAFQFFLRRPRQRPPLSNFFLFLLRPDFLFYFFLTGHCLPLFPCSLRNLCLFFDLTTFQSPPQPAGPSQSVKVAHLHEIINQSVSQWIGDIVYEPERCGREKRSNL